MSGYYNTQGYSGGGGKSYYDNNRRFQGQQQQRSYPVPAALDRFEKCFYRPSPEVLAMSEAEAESIRRDQEIRIVRGDESLKPIRTFKEANYPKGINDALARAGFEKPSAIQCQSWPILLSGHDMIGIAETGSGKTLAFLLPGAVHLMAQPRLRSGDGPVVLVMAPTRELVEQIRQEATKFVGGLGIRVGVAYGGAPRGFQLRGLRQGLEILVACPGRLIDFIESGNCPLNRITYLVLDEADRMLDMGFEPQIRKIVEGIRNDRQTLMFSATWPKEVQGLARDLCNQDPVHVCIGSVDLKASMNITQKVEMVENDSMKYDKLVEVLTSTATGSRCIIFTETKVGCDRLAHELSRSGFQCGSLHGDKSHEERQRVLGAFRNNQVPILIATDIASRGIDIKDLPVVINYDMPSNIHNYIHRIGRTGRAGQTGTAYTFLTKRDQGATRDLVKLLRENNQVVPPELQYAAGGRGGGGGRGYGGASRGRNAPYYPKRRF